MASPGHLMALGFLLPCRRGAKVSHGCLVGMEIFAPRPVKELMEHDGEDASEDGMDDGQGPSFKSLDFTFGIFFFGMITIYIY